MVEKIMKKVTVKDYLNEVKAGDFYRCCDTAWK